jgi:sec-independent protein translocase protein TatA
MTTLLFVGGLGPPELLLIAGVLILLFGASKLPKLARSMGSATGEFKKGRQQVEEELEEIQEGMDPTADIDTTAGGSTEPGTDADTTAEGSTESGTDADTTTEESTGSGTDADTEDLESDPDSERAGS